MPCLQYKLKRFDEAMENPKVHKVYSEEFEIAAYSWYATLPGPAFRFAQHHCCLIYSILNLARSHFLGRRISAHFQIHSMLIGSSWSCREGIMTLGEEEWELVLFRYSCNPLRQSTCQRVSCRTQNSRYRS
jgi:hypothetical protein